MPTEMVEPDRHPPGFYRRLADPAAPAGGRRRSFASWLRRRFVVGFLVSLPLVVTLFFARFLFQLMDRWFRPISHQLFGREIPGIGLLLVLAIMLLLGVIATNVVGGRLLAYLERLIARVPLLSPIYKGARQVTEAIQIGEGAQFRKVVLLEFPGPGLTSVGFVTSEIGAPTRLCPEPAYLIFVPTTPNPTTGFLVTVPKRSVTVLDIPVEDGIKMVMSGGLVVPASLLEPPVASRQLPAPGESENSEPNVES
jgi:uncharacterized membrane protein